MSTEMIGALLDGPGTGAAEPDLPAQRLLYDGRLGDLYRIFVENLLLGIVTFGIYRFWGRTRYRRYLWSHTAFDGDRFEYTGTGGELFRGFLIAIGIFFAGIVGLVLAQIFFGESHPILVGVVTIGFYGFLFFILFAAHFTALRYRLTRTRWRGIRGGLAGSATAYAWRNIGYGLLTILTLSQYQPFATMRLIGYRVNNLFFGTAKANFDGRGRDVYGRYLITFLLSLLIFVLFLGGVAVVPYGMLSVDEIASIKDMFDWAMEDGGISEDEWQFLLQYTELRRLLEWLPFIIIGFVLIWPLLVLFVNCWYLQRLVSYVAARSEIAGLRFVGDVTTGRLAKLVGINFLLLIFTFGIGYPVVLNRLWRFAGDSFVILGKVDGALIAQSQLATPSRGEGFLEVLDPGMV
ncbi:MAG: YjgN family protein [Dongiaceae bacterium]